MGWLSLLAVAVALAMEALAVAVVTGLTVSPLTGRHVFRLSFHFGLFQALMPSIGWAAGVAVHRYIAAFDHWLAFALLAFVAARMIRGALSAVDRDQRVPKDPTSGWELVMLSVATSIDALAVGLTLALLGSAIIVPALVIGIVAAGFTCAGMLLGRRIGPRWGQRVEIIGGLILLAIGVKIVLEHTLG